MSHKKCFLNCFLDEHSSQSRIASRLPEYNQKYLVQDGILNFEVAMNDSVLMEIGEGVTDLIEENGGKGFLFGKWHLLQLILNVSP